MAEASNAPGILSQVLEMLTGAVPANSLHVLEVLASSEGAPASRENPLDTTQPESGATSINSVGVKEYGSPQLGALATYQTLTNGLYPALVSGLKSNAPASYYTSGAAAAELEKWQGGSTLAVRMLGGSGKVATQSNPVAGAAGAVGSAVGTVTGAVTAGWVEGAAAGLGAAAKSFYSASSGSAVLIGVTLLVALILYPLTKGGPSFSFSLAPDQGGESGGQTAGGQPTDPLAAWGFNPAQRDAAQDALDDIAADPDRSFPDDAAAAAAA